MDATAIALSGMRAAQARLDGAAHNIANVQTEGFQRLQVRSEAQLPAGGVRTRAERVPVPGADLAADLVEQKQAAVAFAANGQVVRREQQMLGRWLDTEA
ncbi:flagellar hook-basal body protein [Tepidimonas thermarum]|uniref:Flagellar hook-basal body protein n=1 Tax=Tepidimonas thermarum TaxID=335431 RepID=A0A554X475_9BURK|nr:flagellar basal body protein [Tepidimonas thermarum]TSE30642.1 flagellar hook-basal body protein [Tepidimonas thermarum]